VSVTPVILPKLGLTMDEGRLVGWLKQEGDRVEAGEILFEVETDKATMEVEAPVGGYVRRLLAAAGEEIPVTQVIALLSTTADEPIADEPALAAPAAAPMPAEPSTAAAPGVSPQAAPRSGSSAATGRIIASPAARKRAAELGVDLETVHTTGDRISVDDVEAAHAAAAGASSGPTAPAVAGAGSSAAAPRVPLSRMRRAIAERMTLSFRDVPQFSVARDVDMTAAGVTRTAAGVSYADVLIWAVARTLVDHEALTTHYDPEGLVPGDGIHVGIAVALDDGLLVPVLRDADTKDLPTISRERAVLQDGARAGKLPLEALSGAVITISNLGQHGVDHFTALINPPEAAILAVGRIRDQVIARDGAPVIAPIVSLTLSVDHRVVDGAVAARFLADLADLLEGGLP
jgi:pyruvate dehydrogenase E2 component (dihydrolipoyllysine-residue acetyltransferase)